MRDESTVQRQALKIELDGQINELTSELTERDSEVAHLKESKRRWMRAAIAVALTASVVIAIFGWWSVEAPDQTLTSVVVLSGLLWIATAGWWIVAGTRRALGFAVTALVVPTILASLVELIA